MLKRFQRKDPGLQMTSPHLQIYSTTSPLPRPFPSDLKHILLVIFKMYWQSLPEVSLEVCR